jgi:3-oxosteroid 1-dehydrogenase
MEIGRAMYARHATVPAIPAWVVMDSRARKRYFFGPQFPGKLPQTWIDGGYIKQDNTLEGLAPACGIDPAGLAATVARFNRFAESGVDEDYGRGNSAFTAITATRRTSPIPVSAPLPSRPSGPHHSTPAMSGRAAGRSSTSMPRCCAAMAA